MTTTAHPRVATPQGGSAHRDTARGKARRIGAAVTALAVGGALAIAAPLSASADEERAQSFAEGQFLSGTILGLDLDQVVDLASAQARNDGTQGTQTSKDPLDAEVLQTINVEAPSPQLDLGGVLQLGPVAQFAQANGDGSSRAASGAVADDGAIGVGSNRSTPPANATLDLAALLGDEFASTLVDLKLELGAIAASAQGNLDTASGDYQLASAVLTFSSPAIANLTPKVDAALTQVTDALNQLVGPGGGLVDEVNGLLVSLDPVLNLLGGNGNVTASINTGNLTEAVHSILEDSYGNDAVSFSLETGEVRVDLEALLGGDLNDLAPGTELLTDTIVNQILEGVTGTVATVADQVVDKVEAVLHDASVDIHADLSVNVAQAPLVQEVCQLVDRVLTTPILTTLTNGQIQDLLSDNGLGGLLGGILDGLGLGELNQLLDLGVVGTLTDGITDGLGDIVAVDGVLKEITGFVNQTVQDNVCSTQSTALAPLTTSVVLDIEATIDELLSGVAAKAVADVDILGINTGLDLDVALGDLGGRLLDGLFDADGGVQQLIDELETTLVHPATETLLGTGGDGGLLGGTIGDALRDLVSIKVNIQELSMAGPNGFSASAAAGRIFTQTAVRVSVLNGGVATVNLAQAAVGPNVTRIVDCANPAGCEPGGPGDPGDPTGGGSGGPGSLAYTGIGIATLIAVILALLAAGAYLVRESYRRNHSSVTPLG